MDNNDNDNEIIQKQQHMDWSDKQRRILTCNNMAEILYCIERGYPYNEIELPHYYLLLLDNNNNNITTRTIFTEWKKKQQQDDVDNNKSHNVISNNPIIGVWDRTLFYCNNGWWEYTTNYDEYVFNIQTNTLFIDIRIPKTKSQIFSNNNNNSNSNIITSLNDMDGIQLSYYARQHIFAGYSKIESNNNNDDDDTNESNNDNNNNKRIKTLFPYCCTRHHCIDWNFIGIGRTRPNKWWIELPPNDNDINRKRKRKQWKEWAYATDNHGQHYYCELWEEYYNDNDNSSSNNKPVIALRKTSGRDGVIIIIGDHFNYCLDRIVTNEQKKVTETMMRNNNNNNNITSLVSLIDKCVQDNNQLELARAWLSIQGGHGKIISNKGFVLDHCIEFWKQGTKLWSSKTEINVIGDNNNLENNNCKVIWNNEEWDIFEYSNNLSSIDQLRDILHTGLSE